MSTSAIQKSARPPAAASELVLVAAAILVLHAVCLTQYGWFRDELYYLSCSKRLAWGYVDHPPLSIAALFAIKGLFGESLAAFRAVAALLGALSAVVTGLLARELGGGRFAQTLAALSAGVAPVSLAIGHYYSMNAFDFLVWPAATLLALRAFERPAASRWLALGAVLGLGLLNKWSVLWLGAGIAVHLLLSRRDLLMSRGPWIAAGTAGLIFAPHLLWEARTGWPTLEFMHNARTQKMIPLQPLRFLMGQWLALGPGAAPIWIAGLAAGFLRRSWRALGTIYIATLAILLASGSARVEYLTLPCMALFAAGAVWWESRGRRARHAVMGAALVCTVPLLPFALPLLPVERFIAYQNALGLRPETEERHQMADLPQHYADMFGWPDMADAVARAAERLTDDERRGAIVVVGNYGEAGALERFGAGRVPTIACQHNTWFFWGPPHWDGRVAILVGRERGEVEREFDRVEAAGECGHPLAMPYEQELPIFIAWGFHADLRSAWAEGKHFQ